MPYRSISRDNSRCSPSTSASSNSPIRELQSKSCTAHLIRHLVRSCTATISCSCPAYDATLRDKFRSVDPDPQTELTQAEENWGRQRRERHDCSTILKTDEGWYCLE
jgi:hypothetical protein